MPYFNIVLLGLSSLWAQEVPTNTAVPLKSNYDYHDAFAPFFYTKNGTTTRSASGQPVQNIGKIEQITFLQLN
jgi:hypothetical protein